MKKFSIALIILMITCAIKFYNPPSYAQDASKSPINGEDKLTSKELDDEGLNLNKQIFTLNRGIQKTITDYQMLTDEVKSSLHSFPFQTTFNYINDKDGTYIEIMRYRFIRDPFHNSKVIGQKTRRFRLFYSGQTITKIHTEFFERYYGDNSATRVDIVDPTPGDEQTDDIVFTHTILVNYSFDNSKYRRDIKLIDNKKLKDVQNNIAFPIRNDLRRNFMIPNLVYINNVLLDLAETYYQGKKEGDNIMSEFLMKSMDY